jgi:hypothetical protein
MSNFVVKEYNNVVGTITFYKLIEDKICYWDEFCKKIQKEGVWEDQLVTIISRMDDVANLRRLDEKKFKNVTPAKEKVIEYEIKTRDLGFISSKTKLVMWLYLAEKRVIKNQTLLHLGQLRRDI